jgi:NhaP-type Na+/H+ and K+/H+ antiporter
MSQNVLNTFVPDLSSNWTGWRGAEHVVSEAAPLLIRIEIACIFRNVVFLFYFFGTLDDGQIQQSE